MINYLFGKAYEITNATRLTQREFPDVLGAAFVMQINFKNLSLTLREVEVANSV